MAVFKLERLAYSALRSSHITPKFGAIARRSPMYVSNMARQSRTSLRAVVRRLVRAAVPPAQSLALHVTPGSTVSISVQTSPFATPVLTRSEVALGSALVISKTYLTKTIFGPADNHSTISLPSSQPNQNGSGV